MPTASEAKKALGEDKPYKCPHCDYRCRAPQPLGRHITLHHSDVRRAERVSVTRKTLIEILGVMGQWLMEGKNDPAVTPAVLRALKEQDIKLRASIHLVALSLVERTHHMRVGLRAVDGEVLTRLTGPDSKVFLDTLSNSALRDYQKRLEEALQTNVSVIRGVIDGDKDGLKGIARRLDVLMRELGDGPADLRIPVELPAADREAIREVLSALDAEQGETIDVDGGVTPEPGALVPAGPPVAP